MQDSHSRLWVGTDDNVYCFDGSRFYSLRSSGLPRGLVNSLAEDGEGGIWIGLNGESGWGGSGHGGLYRYRGGHTELVLSGNVRSIVRITPFAMLVSMVNDSSEYMEFGDLYRIKLEAGKWTPLLLARKSAMYLTVNHHGSALYPCPGGVCALTPQEIVHWTDDEPNPKFEDFSGASFPMRILRDRFGCLWLRSEITANVFCRGDKAGIAVPPSVAEGNDYSALLAEAPNGSVLMLGSDLAFGRPGAFHVARAQNGLPAGVNTALIAADGTIWIGAAEGLYRFAYPFELEYWDQRDGVDGPWTLLRKGDRIFAGSSGIYELSKDRSEWRHLVGADRLGTVVSLLNGPRDTLYSASLILGATLLDTRGDILAKMKPGPGGASLVRAANGQVWLGGSGISKIVRHGPRLDAVSEGPDHSVSLDLAYDASHKTVWGCDTGKVVAIHNGHWRQFGRGDGVLKGFCRSIAVTPDGNVWVGDGLNPDLSLIEGANSGHITVRHFSSPPRAGNGGTPVFIGVDRRGWLWVGSDADYIATPAAAAKGNWIPLDSTDGIPLPGGSQNSFYSDSDGSIWFASGDTIVHFLPADGFATRFPSPPIFISGFTTGKGKLILADGVPALTDGDGLEAHVGLLQFDRRNAITVRYRLLPEDSRWNMGSKLDLHLRKIAWGEHTIQLQARLSTGPWSKVAEQSFIILRPIWLTWPFLGGYVLLAGTIVSSGRKWRMRRRERAEKLLPELSEWRLAALSPELQGLSGMTLDGRFEVGRILARGGFATVVEGRDLQRGGLPCALKIFRQDFADKEWLGKHFQREVNALAAICHPNIVTVYGYGATPLGTPYLAMEFIDGSTLRDILETRRPTAAEIARYLRHTGSALDEIHSRGICHRDLKPENLMVRRSGELAGALVLIDFSIAIIKDPDETIHGLSRAAGTFSYMAPEQVIGYANSSTDIYSLAKIAIEMLTGKRLSVLLPDAFIDMPVRVRELLATLPWALSPGAIGILSAALEFDPTRRPREAGKFAARIADDLESGAVTTDDL
jgi:Protein kinase domain